MYFFVAISLVVRWPDTPSLLQLEHEHFLYGTAEPHPPVVGKICSLGSKVTSSKSGDEWLENDHGFEKKTNLPQSMLKETMIHQTFQICKSIKIVLKTKLKVERKEKEIAISHHSREIIKITCP